MDLFPESAPPALEHDLICVHRAVERPCAKLMRRAILGAMGLWMFFATSGCATKSTQKFEGDRPVKGSTAMLVGPGDVLKLSFRKSPDLNQSQRVRPNGRISLFQIGNVHVAGKTIEQVQADLAARYELKEKGEMVVSLEVTGTFVYVTGAVLKPGKLPLERPLTLFEAIVESGNFDSETANRKKVKLTRLENGSYVTRLYNLKANPTTAVFLKPYDIIEVPRFF